MVAEAVPRAKPGETFLLSECYASIQGESSFVGVPTIFVRLYTCNLRCVWCDSMYAVEGGEFREVSIADRRDYEFAQEMLMKHETAAGTILFSPVTAAHKVPQGLDPAALARWILDDRLNVRLQPQVHKYIWPGETRGV